MSITPEYQLILRRIHESSPFGKRSKIPLHFKEFVETIQPESILDFGCGKGRLVQSLTDEYPDKKIAGYDPANTEFDYSLDNIFVDLLMSTDVLEHIEPELLDETLLYLSTKSKYIYHLIALSPAKKILPDGRNAHLILESKEWWRDKFVNLGYKIIKEDYTEGYKESKELRNKILVKKYFIMAEK
jgi:hypothetical protein